MTGRLIIRLTMLVMLSATCDAMHLENKVKRPYWLERYHYPGLYTPRPNTWLAPDTWVPEIKHTPDFRLAEPHYTVYEKDFFKEYNRPYRISPHHKQTKNYDRNEKAWLLACYCATTYRISQVLGVCSIVTQRHVITTATSVDVVLRNYKPVAILQNILSIAYEHTKNVFNATLYHEGVSRIHYHPKYQRDYEGNMSHPLPCLYDIAVLATYYNLGRPKYPNIVICQRAGSSYYAYVAATAYDGDDHFNVGLLFMKAYGRRPLSTFRYAVRTDRLVRPCPKSDWHWVQCIPGEWARFGMDSGGALHYVDRGRRSRRDGLAGLCTFSMRLRSKDILHYYTVVDCYPVLDFLYDAYFGYMQYEFLDARFYNSQGYAPRLYYTYYIPAFYTHGFQPTRYNPPNYRR